VRSGWRWLLRALSLRLYTRRAAAIGCDEVLLELIDVAEPSPNLAGARQLVVTPKRSVADELRQPG
jgi:hypothetical protein